MWRWDEDKSHLAPVTGLLAEQAVKAAEARVSEEDRDDGDDSQPALPEGWHHSYLTAGRTGSKNIAVQLERSTATIRVEQRKTGTKSEILTPLTITLEAADLAKPFQILGAEVDGTKEITAAEFAAIQAKDPSPRPRRSAWQTAWSLSEYLIILMIPLAPFLVSVLSILRLKSKVLANLPMEASFPNVVLEQFPALDKGRLEELTRTVENLGFKRLFDYTMVAKMAIVVPGFGRLLVNEKSRCFAEINQVFPPGKKPTELACTFVTRFDDWSVSTTPRRPNGGGWIMRCPRSVWRCKPGLDPASLLQAHVQQCSELTTELGVVPLPARGAEDFFADTLSRMRERRSVVAKKSVFRILLEFYVFRFRPRLEWKGDWPKEAMKRTGFVPSTASADLEPRLGR